MWVFRYWYLKIFYRFSCWQPALVYSTFTSDEWHKNKQSSLDTWTSLRKSTKIALASLVSLPVSLFSLYLSFHYNNFPSFYFILFYFGGQDKSIFFTYILLFVVGYLCFRLTNFIWNFTSFCPLKSLIQYYFYNNFVTFSTQNLFSCTRFSSLSYHI